MGPVIPTCIVPSVRPARLTPRQVKREFDGLLAQGVPIRPAGRARRNPRSLLARGYAPRHRIDLFDVRYYLAEVRQNEDVRFFVAYVVGTFAPQRSPAIHPRIFYKDNSLVWRSASHFVRSENENWIGKGDVRSFVVDGEEFVGSAEATTDLPHEVQTALEDLCRGARRVRYDVTALDLVLRRAPDDRIEAYRDFTAPRVRAQSNPRNRIHGGRRIARFTRPGDPASLRFVAGYEPDFRQGILEKSASTSRLYGGRVRRFRILSTNRRIQYLFLAGPQQVWIIPPQATTTQLSSYGVRTVDVIADDDLCVPAFEYHAEDGGADVGVPATQIPGGYVGALSSVDASRADASPWLDRLPVIREFRRRVLARRRRSARSR